MASAFWNATKGKFYAKIQVDGRWASRPIKSQLARPGPKPPVGREFLTAKQAQLKAIKMEIEAEEAPARNETFDWMVTFHDQKYGVNLESDRADSFFEKHLRDCSMSRVLMRGIESHHIREFLESKKGDLSPESINKLRQRIYKLIKLAAEKGLCALPSEKIERLPVPKREDEYLRFHEVAPTFAQLRGDIRGLFWTVVMLGPRKQEPLHLRKVDVDVVGWSLVFRKTKTRAERKVPIPEPLRPWILEAMKSPGPWLFPDPTKNGKQYRSESKFDRLLRTAMGRAGFVRHYRAVCRRKECGFHDERQAVGEARCPRPECNFRLSFYGVARHVRFHDLRHTTGTLLANLKVPIQVIADILGHTDINMTRRYLRVDMEDMAEALNTLGMRIAPQVETAPTAQQDVAANGLDYGSLMVSGIASPKSEARDSENSLVESRALEVGARGFEPPTPCAQGTTREVIRPLHAAASVRLHSGMRGARKSSALPDLTPDCSDFGSLMVSAPPARLLTVRQVADALNICAATVYALCERGEMEHTRVSNAIRVRPVDLEAYLDRARFQTTLRVTRAKGDQ